MTTARITITRLTSSYKGGDWYDFMAWTQASTTANRCTATNSLKSGANIVIHRLGPLLMDRTACLGWSTDSWASWAPTWRPVRGCTPFCASSSPVVHSWNQPSHTGRQAIIIMHTFRWHVASQYRAYLHRLHLYKPKFDVRGP